MGCVALLLTDDAEKLHGTENETQQDNILQHADQQPQRRVDAPQAKPLERLGQYIGHNAEHHRHHDPDDDESQHVAQILGYTRISRKDRSQVFTELVVKLVGNEQADKESGHGNHLLEQSAAPALPGPPYKNNQYDNIYG